MQQVISLSLTLEQVNTIFAALGKLPYENVYLLINELGRQIDPQVNRKPESFNN